MILQFTIEYNFSLQEQTSTRATVIGQDRYAAPTDFADWKTMFVVDPDGISVDELIFRNRSWMENEYGLDLSAAGRGKPIYVTFDREEFMVRPVPDLTTYTLRLHYYILPPALTVGQSNYFTANWPKLLEAGALMALYSQIGNEQRYGFWEKVYEKQLDKLKLATRKRQIKSMITLPMRPGPLLNRSTRQLNVGYPWWGKF